MVPSNKTEDVFGAYDDLFGIATELRGIAGAVSYLHPRLATDLHDLVKCLVSSTEFLRNTHIDTLSEQCRKNEENAKNMVRIALSVFESKETSK